MLKIFLSMLLMFFSLFMFFMNHPLSMGLMILVQTLLICMLSGMLISTYWFSYILFLTFMGGLLVLFIYVSSVASNELFSSSMLNKIFFINFILFSLMMSFIYKYNLIWMNFSYNLEMNNFFDYYFFFNNENKINLTKLYNNQTFLIMIMMIIYLFITLVAVVKISNIFFGPLRSTN